MKPVIHQGHQAQHSPEFHNQKRINSDKAREQGKAAMPQPKQTRQPR